MYDDLYTLILGLKAMNMGICEVYVQVEECTTGLSLGGFGKRTLSLGRPEIYKFTEHPRQASFSRIKQGLLLISHVLMPATVPLRMRINGVVHFMCPL